MNKNKAEPFSEAKEEEHECEYCFAKGVYTEAVCLYQGKPSCFKCVLEFIKKQRNPSPVAKHKKYEETKNGVRVGYNRAETPDVRDIGNKYRSPKFQDDGFGDFAAQIRKTKEQHSPNRHKHKFPNPDQITEGARTIITSRSPKRPILPSMSNKEVTNSSPIHSTQDLHNILNPQIDHHQHQHHKHKHKEQKHKSKLQHLLQKSRTALRKQVITNIAPMSVPIFSKQSLVHEDEKEENLERGGSDVGTNITPVSRKRYTINKYKREDIFNFLYDCIVQENMGKYDDYLSYMADRDTINGDDLHSACDEKGQFLFVLRGEALGGPIYLGGFSDTGWYEDFEYMHDKNCGCFLVYTSLIYICEFGASLVNNSRDEISFGHRGVSFKFDFLNFTATSSTLTKLIAKLFRQNPALQKEIPNIDLIQMNELKVYLNLF